MSFRHAPTPVPFRPVAFAAVAICAISALAGCAAPASIAPVAQVPVAPATAPSPTPVPTATPRPTPTPAPIAVLEPDPTPTRGPNEGDVDGAVGFPQVSIEFADDTTVDATIDDPAAKAWRIVIQGIGELATDRLELLVDSGDVQPAITATEIRGGKVVAETDLSGFADGTATDAVCHPTLHACINPGGFTLPDGGNGTLRVRLTLPDPSTPLDVTAATATWPGEPFVLGPWRDAETFPWGDR